MKKDLSKQNDKKAESQLIAEYIALHAESEKEYAFKFYSDGKVKVNNELFDIWLEEDTDEDLIFIKSGDKRYPAEIFDKKQNKYNILINGLNYVFTIETPLSYRRKKYFGQDGPDTKTQNIIATMSGKITDVFVDIDSEVREGEPLFILESMKMQNEISSPVKGKVVKLNIKPNDTVMKDEILIEIQK